MASAKKQLLLLEELIRQLNVRVRYEKITTTTPGGLCRHNGEYQVIIDKKASEDLKIDLLANAIKTFDLSDMFIPPKIRDLLDQ